MNIGSGHPNKPHPVVELSLLTGCTIMDFQPPSESHGEKPSGSGVKIMGDFLWYNYNYVIICYNNLPTIQLQRKMHFQVIVQHSHRK